MSKKTALDSKHNSGFRNKAETLGVALSKKTVLDSKGKHNILKSSKNKVTKSTEFSNKFLENFSPKMKAQAEFFTKLNLRKAGYRAFLKNSYLKRILMKARIPLKKKKFFRSKIRSEALPMKWFGVVSSNKFINILKLVNNRLFKAKSRIIFDKFLFSKNNNNFFNKSNLFQGMKSVVFSGKVSRSLAFLNKFHYFNFLKLVFF